MDTSDVLSDKIRRAFASIPRPRANRVGGESDWDAENIERDFAPFLNGEPVSENVLIANAKSLPALTPTAFAYFLKDYLIYSLSNSRVTSSRT